MSEFALDAFLDMPDDDDMPPLVDRPPPQMMSMMSYSFDTDFAPVLYSPHSSVADVPPELTPRFELISEEDAPRISATKPSHAKKRDAGHIPRPPNAFILFRSSFIKSESVPGNIEGNHSTLSKIIGIVWKTLPPAERELWEKRAVQAQAEHRARYPDWRFRPGTNVDAIAKRKTKDKNKDRPPARRKRRANTRDKGSAAAVAAAATDGGGTPTGAAAAAASGRCNARGLIQERRCAQIAELLARGVKGVALTSAVQAWDKQSGVSNVIDGVFVSEQGVGAGAGADDANRGRKEMRAPPKDTEAVAAAAAAIKTTKTRSASSAQQQARFNFSLTSMYRRASSAPLVPDHEAAAQGAVPITTATTSISPVPDFYPPPLSPASSVSYGSEVSFPDSDNMSVSACAPPSPPLRFLFSPCVVTFFFLPHLFLFFQFFRCLRCSISCLSRHPAAPAAPVWTTTISARSARYTRPLPVRAASLPPPPRHQGKGRGPRRPCRVSSRATRRSVTGPAASLPPSSQRWRTRAITAPARSSCRRTGALAARATTRSRSCTILLRGSSPSRTRGITIASSRIIWSSRARCSAAAHSRIPLGLARGSSRLPRRTRDRPYPPMCPRCSHLCLLCSVCLSCLSSCMR
ncbi:hypothetical protein BC826DRAFT_51339 [Russula brevipes]|nr:hypothetical protein BC826DRAFT_51339 [Russula brevipes]